MMKFEEYIKEGRDNSHLTRAKMSKDDEFYTSYEHAKQMTIPFIKHFAGKSILCNCDDPYRSQVFKFLRDNFDAFKMKKLVGVGYKSVMQVITDDDIYDIDVKNNGDFRSGESLDALKECDIVVSNPPFSDNMFIDFIKLIMQNKKDVLAIGPLDGAKAKDVKPYIISGKLNCIKSPYQNFVRPKTAKSSAKQVKVAIFTTFSEDPFGTEIELDEDIDIEKLPYESKRFIPVSISHDGKFSINEIPAECSDAVDKIIVPLHIFRKSWKKHFKIIDILNTVNCNGKKLMCGVVMEYI